MGQQKSGISNLKVIVRRFVSVVGIRPKLFLVFFTCGILPMLVFVVANYWSGVGAVEEVLGRDVEREAQAIVTDIETALHDRETGLTALSRTHALRDYARDGAKPSSPVSDDNLTAPLTPLAVPSPTDTGAAGEGDALPPPDVRNAVEAFLIHNRNDYAALTLLDANRQPLFRVESGRDEASGQGIRYQTSNFLPSGIVPDQLVWTAAEQTPLRPALLQESFGTIVRYTVPIFTGGTTAHDKRGALIFDLRLGALCKKAIGNLAGAPAATRFFVVLDGGGRIVCYTNEAQVYQPVANVLPPSFKAIADSMQAGEAGRQFFDWQGGHRWLTGYQPLITIGASLAVGVDETEALHSLRRSGWLGIILSALAGLLTAALLMLMARRMERSIERVTEGAVAIAGGQLDQRIEVRSSDETRLLAESFNRMTDRLREQIARETETKQFESFMRLAAMLTHDLKNAITALSLVVSNMEQQFDREEFRAEAMESLKESTDNLRALVSKLSGPVESLSGEFQRPRPTDLIPHLNRVLKGTAEQARRQHKVEIHLPPTLVATVDAERMERVFENLVLNALEAMGAQSGTLSIEAGPAGTDEIFFSVADTGPGISEEFRRTRLFRAFATTKKKGVGLGLYTCQEVVRAHGGRIEVKSEKGAGATFRVVLPSARFAWGE